ncbi:MAG: TIGR01777 family oxidoreductase [bacterium]
MKILITGGTGFVGRQLWASLLSQGHQVTVLTRGPSKAAGVNAPDYLQGDPTRPGKWQEVVAQQDVLINLAGTSIFGRWTAQYKEELRSSRILTTRNLVEAITEGIGKTLVSASGAGYYGFHGDEELDESSPAGQDFLARLAADWEAEAMKASGKGVRVLITRFGIVLGSTGGALQQMITPFKWFVGGPLGSGLQWFSWIHVQDLVRAMLFLLEHPHLSGAFNFTSPNPVRNKELSRALGKALGRPWWLPTPGFMLRLVLGEFGEVLLQGQRVIPRRLLESGFSFRYPALEDTLEDLLISRGSP